MRSGGCYKILAMKSDALKPPILVTGAAGFIGARFVESCAERGIPVVSVDRTEYFTSRPEHQGIDFGRIVDRDDLFAWLRKERPRLSAIMHLGACTDTMVLDEAYLRKTNLEYSQAIWEYASRERVPLVYASSGATYGDGSQGYDDDEALLPKLEPLNPYGMSKQLFDLWALERERAGERPPHWSGFKFFNVYGFGERHKNKMASVALHARDQILKTGKARLFKSHREGIADGEQKRDFVSVEDVVSVLHFAREKPIDRGIFNLGTGRARTFLDLVRGVFAALGRPVHIEFIVTPEVLRTRYQYFTEARMERLRREGYAKPFLSLEEGVARYMKRLSSAPR
jgi:ADP-L-glycero-D-manno-heptose 6-epimerase